MNKPLVTLLAALAAAPAGARAQTAAPPPVHPALAAHSAEFEKKVYEVTDGVYSAVGFALANSILLEGENGVVIVDVTESVETGREVLAAFREITEKPIVAIIYTHNHGDHVFGARGFVPEGEIDVYAHATTSRYIDRVVSVLRPAISARSARMFGNLLPSGEDGVVNAGIGPFLALRTPSLMRPNRTFDDRLEIEIEGIRLELVHAPGETNDQIFVWLPDKKVLLPGDNIYRTFPNLYTIRGTPYRDVTAWVRSLDAMRALAPEHVVPSHTRPFSGADHVAGVLTAYRDAIQFVHDQTVRGINRGLTPDQLVETVRLPDHLAEHPYLAEHYGTVEWSVRNIFSGYLGWFDGDAATLSPTPPAERARGFAELAGGVENLRAAARRALDAGSDAWAAELAAELLRLDSEDAEARAVKTAALRRMGRTSISPNGRHYYLTQALELEEGVDPASALSIGGIEMLKAIPIGNVLASLPVRLDPEKSREVDLAVGFRFPDEGSEYTLHVRRGVAEFQPRLKPDAAVVLTASSDVFLEVMLGLLPMTQALTGGSLALDGEAAELGRFLALFDPS